MCFSISDNETQSAATSATSATSVSVKSRRTNKKTFDDMKFVELLAKYGKVLLDKRLTPAVKAQKETAVNLMVQKLQIHHGIEMTTVQLKKKVHNLKARLKERTDLKKTGNKAIVLTASEKKLFELLGGIDNPSVTKVSYKL